MNISPGFELAAAAVVLLTSASDLVRKTPPPPFQAIAYVTFRPRLCICTRELCSGLIIPVAASSFEFGEGGVGEGVWTRGGCGGLFVVV